MIDLYELSAENLLELYEQFVKMNHYDPTDTFEEYKNLIDINNRRITRYDVRSVLMERLIR